MTTTINNEHEKNQGQKVLNVPTKREQSQACLSYAEREGLRPKNNVPNLRFPEFEGEWEKFTFDEIAQYKKGPFGSALKKDIFVPQSEDTIKVYEQQNAIKKDWTLSRYYITKGYFNSHMKQFVAKAGDLIVSCAGTIGEIYELPQDAEEGVFNQALMRVQVNDEAVNKEIFITVFSSMIDKFSKIYSNGSAIKNIPPFADLKKTQVFLPCKEEQKKIAKLLALLDERIATQSKIIEDLNKLKSAISKHLFTRKDLLETTICLADIATLKNGYAFQSSKYNTQGKWKVLTIANVSGERYISDDDCNCITTLPNDIQDHQVLKEGDILISLTGNVGRVSLCKAGNYLLNQRVGLLLLAKNVDKEFIYQVLSSQRFENSMIACGQGAAQMNIGKGDVESYILPYSSNANNIRMIAEILQSYDEFIINELRVQTLLTMQKQYFLHQMFI